VTPNHQRTMRSTFLTLALLAVMAIVAVDAINCGVRTHIHKHACRAQWRGRRRTGDGHWAAMTFDALRPPTHSHPPCCSPLCVYMCRLSPLLLFLLPPLPLWSHRAIARATAAPAARAVPRRPMSTWPSGAASLEAGTRRRFAQHTHRNIHTHHIGTTLLMLIYTLMGSCAHSNRRGSRTASGRRPAKHLMR
jgi:hypothetical protein